MLADHRLAFELQNVIIQFRKTNISKYKYSKLKGAEKCILFLIDELKTQGPVTISEIANRIRVTLAAVTHQINALEKKGFVIRFNSNNDRRVVQIKLTKSGSLQVTKLKKDFSLKTQILAEFLGEKDMKHLIRLVKKMSEFSEFIK